MTPSLQSSPPLQAANSGIGSGFSPGSAPGIRAIEITLPKTLAFGVGCATTCIDALVARRSRVILIVSSSIVAQLSSQWIQALRIATVADVHVWTDVNSEPTVAMFESALAAAKSARPDAIIGLGGGSPMDVAKLVAALLNSTQSIRDCFGIGKLNSRDTYLACVPTTAGTGSEVSPNAILLDEHDQLKKGVVSPLLVPDAAFVDPAFTVGVPAEVTAATGMDALTHCIEAYANKFAHPLIDHYALEGIRCIASNLTTAVEQPNNLDARSAMALGSMYGGLCLGPVNTGAVHALAYPLGGEFHIAHGVSNALLLPHVLEFNLSAAVDRYANIAIALGAAPQRDDLATAREGLKIIRDLSLRCRIPARLSDFNVPFDAIDRMATAALTVTRLLVRNVREVTHEDAVRIYRKAY